MENSADVFAFFSLDFRDCAMGLEKKISKMGKENFKDWKGKTLAKESPKEIRAVEIEICYLLTGVTWSESIPIFG